MQGKISCNKHLGTGVYIYSICIISKTWEQPRRDGRYVVIYLQIPRSLFTGRMSSNIYHKVQLILSISTSLNCDKYAALTLECQRGETVNSVAVEGVYVSMVIYALFFCKSKTALKTQRTSG